MQRNRLFLFTKTAATILFLFLMGMAGIFKLQRASASPAATITWTNASGGNWSNASNWDIGVVPGVGDDVVINLDGTYAVVLDASATVNSLTMGGNTGVQTLTQNGTTLTLNSASSMNSNVVYNFQAGTLNGTGELTVSGVLNWSGGTMNGSSATTTIASGGVMNIMGTGIKNLQDDGRILNNQGTINWTGTNFRFGGGGGGGNGATINNSGLFDIQVDLDIGYLGNGTPQFINSGTVRKSAGSGWASLGTVTNFVNSGAVEVNSGSLQCYYGSSTGGFTTAVGSVIAFTGSPYTFNSGTTFSVDALQVNGGVVNVDAAVPVTGTLTFNGGTLQGTGGNLIINDRLDWNGGTMQGVYTTTVAVSATMNITGTGNKYLQGHGRIIDNYGTINWAGTNFRIGGGGGGETGATINNAGLFDIQGDFSAIYIGNGTPQFVNTGTVRKSAGSGTASFSSGVINFVHSGTLEVNSGTLQIADGSSSSAFTTAVGAALEFTNGTYTFNNGTALSGDTFQVSGGTLNVNAAVPVTGTLAFDSGTLQGTGGNLIINDQLDWNSGTMQGVNTTTVAVGATMNITGTGNKYLRDDGRIINNYGTINWTGTNFRIGGGGGGGDGAAIHNAGLFDIQGDLSAIYIGNGTPQFVNSGTVRKSAGSGTASFSNAAINFVNSGMLEVNSGTLQIADGSSSSEFTTAVGAAVEFAIGTYTFSDGAVLADGTFQINGGTINVDAAVPVTGTLVFNSGTLQGAGGNLIINNQMDWHGGTMQGANTTTVAVGATMNITGTSTKDLRDENRILDNYGTINWAGTNFRFGGGGGGGDGATIHNAGLFDIREDVAIVYLGNGDPIFNNSGTLRKSAGSGTASLHIPMDFNNTGTVEALAGVLHLPDDYVQTSGVTRLNGGALLSSGTAAIQGGVLEGTGTITGTVQNSGQITPGQSAGQIDIDGDLTQSAAGDIGIELGGVTGGATYDLLRVHGSAALDGSLSVSLIDGFTPAVNDSFTVVTYDSRSGAVSTYNLPDIAGLTWEVVEGDTSIVLNVKAVDLALAGAAVPSPVLAGDTLTYTLDITNTGNLTGTNVIVTDTLPGEATFVSGVTSLGGSCTAVSSVVCPLGDVGPGGTAVVTITVAVDPAARGSMTNTAVVAADQDEPVTSDNSISIQTTINAAADLNLQHTSSDPVASGLRLSYTITVTNNGPSNATGVVLTDTLPAGVVYLAGSTGCTENTGVVVCSIGAIGAHGYEAITLQVSLEELAAGDVIVNNAVVTAVETDPDAGNNTASVSTAVPWLLYTPLIMTP